MKFFSRILIALFLTGLAFPVMAFQVRGKAISTTFCSDGGCKTDPCNDEVVYEVDMENEKIFRRAIINNQEGLKDTPFSGLHGDDTVYHVLQVQSVPTSRNGTPKVQKIIKAVGKAGLLDGIEIVAIGEDFIHTSRSSSDSFVIYYYKIVD